MTQKILDWFEAKFNSIVGGSLADAILDLENERDDMVLRIEELNQTIRLLKQHELQRATKL